MTNSSGLFSFLRLSRRIFPSSSCSSAISAPLYFLTRKASSLPSKEVATTAISARNMVTPAQALLSAPTTFGHYCKNGGFSYCWASSHLNFSLNHRHSSSFFFSTISQESSSTADNDSFNYRPPGWELLQSPPRPEERIRGAMVGIVVSNKMQKSVNVAVDRYRMNFKYNKRIRFTRKFMAHDEEEVCSMGDMVKIVPDRRRSKRKHFRIHEIIRAKGLL